MKHIITLILISLLVACTPAIRPQEKTIRPSESSLPRNADYDRVIENQTRAISANQQSPRAYFERGVAFDLKGQHDRALQDLNKAISLNPEYAN